MKISPIILEQVWPSTMQPSARQMSKVKKRSFYTSTNAKSNSSVSGIFKAVLNGIPLKKDA